MHDQPRTGRTRAGRDAVARRALAAVVLALPVATTACGVDDLTATSIDTLDVATVESQAQLLGVGAAGTPLYIVDGVIVSESAARGVVSKSIASVEVVKGPVAAVRYGDRGAHGVIMIRTRDGAAATADGIAAGAGQRTVARDRGDGNVERIIVRSAGDGKAEQIVVRSAGEETAAQPLFIIDGVIAERRAMERLRPDDVERIEVITGAAAVSVYGDRGANGIVNITTRQRF